MENTDRIQSIVTASMEEIHPIGRESTGLTQSIERENIGSIQSKGKESTDQEEPIRKDSVEPVGGDRQEKVLKLSESQRNVVPGLSEMRSMTTKDLLNLFEITIQSWESKTKLDD